MVSCEAGGAYPVDGSTVILAREGSPVAPRPPRLLDRVRHALRARHAGRRTEKAYVAWSRRYILFHDKRHPAEMGGPEVSKFLTSLAVDGNVAASTQNQALRALLFLYRHVLEQDLPWLDGVVRARRPPHLPVVLTRDEVRLIVQALHGPPRLMALLLYGAGLRLLECAQLRVKDIDFGANQIVVRAGKGSKDRVTMLLAAAKADLARHLEVVKEQHATDLRHGAGWVELPWALSRKYPNAGREWGWQWVFPATRLYVERVTGQRRRHHEGPASGAPPTGCSCDAAVSNAASRTGLSWSAYQGGIGGHRTDKCAGKRRISTAPAPAGFELR